MSNLEGDIATAIEIREIFDLTSFDILETSYETHDGWWLRINSNEYKFFAYDDDEDDIEVDSED